MEQDDERRTVKMDAPSAMEDPHGIARGTDVGGYIIDGELGRGGMGVVYSATHPVIGKRAAIKVLKPSLSNNPATVERFTQEARAVNQIGHPNIVDIFAFGQLPDGRSYLVMDLLEGESLRARVKRGPLHVREATNVIDEIASALMAAHDKGFVHRDLKPDNVFLVSHPGRFDVRLLDFGLAKLLPNATTSRAFRTATGAQIGTPDYMSPEQLRGSNVDHRTDVYALGVMAFEIFIGKRPRRFGDGTFERDREPTQVLSAIPHVTTELAQLVEAMMAGQAEERPSLSAVRAVIKRVRPSLPSLSVVGLKLQPPAVAQVSDPSLDSLTASKVGARPVLPTPAAGNPAVAQPPPQPPTSAGLARTSSQHPVTTIGVPPPPAPSSQPPPVSKVIEVQAAPRESRIWLVVGAALAVVAGIALAIMLTT